MICIIMGICALHVFFKAVKRFEFAKALCKFPIIIILLYHLLFWNRRKVTNIP